MRYYYDVTTVPSSKEKATNELKEEWETEAEKLAKIIKKKIPDVKYFWTRRDTLGFVFTDFEPKDEKKIIGAGATGLRKKIQEDYDFVLLSGNVTGKHSEIKSEGKKGIKINIEYFNNIFKKAGNTEKVVELFLSKPVLDEFEEDAIKKIIHDDPEKLKQYMDFESTLDTLRLHGADKPEEFSKMMQEMLQFSKEHEIQNYKDFQEILEKAVRFFELYKISNPDDFTNVANSLIDILEKYDIGTVNTEKFLSAMLKQIKTQKISSVDDLEKLIEITKATERSIINGHTYFEEILEEFRKKIDTDIAEIEIRNFVFKHIWLLDFRYYGYRKLKEEHLEIGNTDLTLYDDQLGLNTIIINEFKRPDEPTVTQNDRPNKDAVLSKVGRAISQTIHYMEEIKDKKNHVEGYVIIGRRKESKDYFLTKFNEYLHGIKIRTFDDLYDDAKATIETFKQFSKVEKPD
ncbi:MAG: DUF4263 domain-containing protein [Nitrosopumilus sp.]|uniref:Shedu anti-phage system protein SduA domain-containing protein n=1 Tax=Nitrosopumilus sp. TaxID=2024843 RepID=UPI00247D0BE2|nr:Shedu anti-phage system protein SduA domain-containing protein [Nitrosopumilus sp.]MCV0392105.1 DUF4263 domain-containing protein [Nitrosopumilus sp.]